MITLKLHEVNQNRPMSDHLVTPSKKETFTVVISPLVVAKELALGQVAVITATFFLN